MHLYVFIKHKEEDWDGWEFLIFFVSSKSQKLKVTEAESYMNELCFSG